MKKMIQVLLVGLVLSGCINSSEPQAPINTTPGSGTATSPALLDCKDVKAAGEGPYKRGVDPEYSQYEDRDRDGLVCE